MVNYVKQQTYNVKEMMKISKLNIDQKLKEIRNLISLWRPRKMTPYANDTVIKSLSISKVLVTHILLSLPSPGPDTVDILDGVFRDFFMGW